ncbi:hypothetical protein ACFW04_010511 [Cataglyphis niger]
MPKIKKFKELSRRQQNCRLLQVRKNDNISISLPKRLVTNNKQDFSYIECSLKNQNSTRQLFPEVEIQNIESDDIELDNNIEDSNLLYNNRDKQKSILHEQLHIWATKYNITQKSLTALLCILREEGHNDLPNDARTLLETLKNTIIQECGDGHYFYYGLEKALREKLKSYKNINNNIIEININIDGLPLTKSSQSQLWPVLGQIYNIHITEPFLIAAFHGYKKSTHAQDLLKEFCDEYRILHEEGFLFENKNYRVTIRAIICDTPAKSFVTGSKGHNAYFGYGECFCEGDYINHKMIFLDENAPLRTNSNFRTRENEEHHICISPFENLDVNMINNFPLDYMHLIWTQVQELSRDIIELREYIPIEFARRPRDINELDRCKATEYRIFFLYLEPIILNRYLNADYFQHFCVLHTAIRILSHPEDCFRNNLYANQLLLYFVKMFKILYGNDNLVYNVHNLIHLSEDVKRYGSLDTFSAFPINENARFAINSQNIIPNASLLLKPNRKHLSLGCVNSHKQIKFKNFVLTTKFANNCCYLKDGSVFCIEYIGFKYENPVILGKNVLILDPYQDIHVILKICKYI